MTQCQFAKGEVWTKVRARFTLAHRNLFHGSPDNWDKFESAIRIDRNGHHYYLRNEDQVPFNARVIEEEA